MSLSNLSHKVYHFPYAFTSHFRVAYSRHFVFSYTLLAGLMLMESSGIAGEWNPATFAEESTLEFLTVGPQEGEHWSTVWLVVLDGKMYVRLGNRAAKRVRENTTAPYVSVRIAGQQFNTVRLVEAPDMVEKVAQAMAEKYWSDLFIRWFPHPLTLRLELEQ
jgi:hypothetical protein